MTRSFLKCANTSLWQIKNKTMNSKIDFSKKVQLAQSKFD